MIPAIKHNTSQTFTGFYKIKGSAHELKPLINPINDALPESFVFFKKKTVHDRTLYILTGEHQDKFLDYIGKMDFMDLKQHVEKIFGEKAVKLKLDKVQKQLEKGTLSL